MIERFYSGDYEGKFYAVCDEIELPFWGISGRYSNKTSKPFFYYIDDSGIPQVCVGGRGNTHGETIAYWTGGKVRRSQGMCGRIWECKRKILTIWEEDTPINLLSASAFETLVDILNKKGIDISDSFLVFEGYENDVKGWNFAKTNFYIYTIPLSEYISKKMSSFKDVIIEYNAQERKAEAARSSISSRWDDFDYKNQGVGYLGYHLMTRQDEGKNMLNESILVDGLPDDIKAALLNNTTSLGNNPAIPDIYDIPFLLKVASNRFEDIKDTLREIGEIDDFEDTDINSMLGKLINKCKELERPFRNELEKLCLNYVIDTFNVPEDTVEINISLKDSIDLDAKSIIVDPIDGDEDFQFDDVEMASNIRGEVYKRRILDALSMGEAIVLSSDIDSYAESIEKISPELCDLYYKIIALNNYSIYMSEDFGIDDKHKNQLGTVNVEFGNEDEQVRITAQGVIFPILLSETLRGFMELFVSHGLPKDKTTAEIVIGKSDFLKAEPWDMRLGPSLWILMSKSFNDITLNELPYLLKRIASLDIDKFNFLMKEVFARTKKGRMIMSKICANAKDDIEYTRFTDKMSKMKVDKSIITDEYISENEL